MDISARTMYGLRALVTLARVRSNRPLSIQAIADLEQLPAKFLEGIMGDLKRGGFVRSRRGASGGYLLARAASEITLLDVISHLEGPEVLTPFEDRSPGGETTEVQLAFGPVWSEIGEARLRVLGRYTVQSIADSVPELPLGDFHPIYQI